MFNCLIVTPNRFLNQGLSALIKGSLTDLNFKDEVIFNRSPANYADAIFIDTNVQNFYRSLGKAVSYNRKIEIFIISDETENSRILNTSRKEMANVIYREERIESIRSNITQALQRGLCLDSPVSLTHNEQIKDRVIPNYHESLTANEHEVITLFVRGFSGKSIAQILRKSEKTISTQKRSVMSKLGATSNQELLSKIVAIA